MLSGLENRGQGSTLLSVLGLSGCQRAGPPAPPATCPPSLSRFEPGDKHRDSLTTWRGVDAGIPRNAFTDYICLISSGQGPGIEVG